MDVLQSVPLKFKLAVFQEIRKQKFEIYGGLPSFPDYLVVRSQHKVFTVWPPHSGQPLMLNKVRACIRFHRLQTLPR